MNRLEELNKAADIKELNKNTEIKFSNEVLDKFEKLMNSTGLKSSESIISSLFKDVTDNTKRNIDVNECRTMERSCISAINETAEKFEDGNWERYSPEERAEVLDLLAKRIGEICKINIKGVQFFKGPPNCRGFEVGNGYLYLHNDYLENPELKEEALNTLLHETRHTFQKAVVNDPASYDIDAETVKRWKNNFRHYLDPEKFGYMRYYTQPVEMDANMFAEYVLNHREF